MVQVLDPLTGRVVDYGGPTPETGMTQPTSAMSPAPSAPAPPLPPETMSSSKTGMVVDRAMPTPETGMTAASAIPSTNVGTMNIPGGAIAPEVYSALKAQGVDVEAALAAWRSSPEGQAAVQAQSDRDARMAAYKAANPGASDFQANYYSMTPEQQAQMQANYGAPAGGNLHKSMYYTGTAPTAGQSMLDYMLANTGQMPQTAVREGPGLGGALLNAALLASAGLGVGAIGNAIRAGTLFGGGAAAGAGAAAGGSAIPSTVAGLVPTSTALGPGSLAGQLGASLAGAAAPAAATSLLPAATPVSSLGATTLAPSAIPSTVSGLVPTSAALGPGSVAGQMAATLAGGSTSGTIAGTGAAPGATAGGNTIDELVITAAKRGGIDPAILMGGGLTTAGLAATGATYADPNLPPGAQPNEVEGLDVVAAKPTSLPPLFPPLTLSPLTVSAVPPTISSFQSGLTTMPPVTLAPAGGFGLSDLTNLLPTGGGGQQTGGGVTGGIGTGTGVGGDTGTGPTLKRFDGTMGSEPFNLNQFFAGMTSPRAGQANLGNVSPFSGGGVGPGAGPLNLKGSSAPDIYPWVQDSGG